MQYAMRLLAACMTACLSGALTFAGEDPVDSEIRQEDPALAQFIAQREKGYRARPCGLDMNRNGILGEEADRLAGDGKTADPDGDGVDEDLLFLLHVGSVASGDPLRGRQRRRASAGYHHRRRQYHDRAL